MYTETHYIRRPEPEVGIGPTDMFEAKQKAQVASAGIPNSLDQLDKQCESLGILIGALNERLMPVMVVKDERTLATSNENVSVRVKSRTANHIDNIRDRLSDATNQLTYILNALDI